MKILSLYCGAGGIDEGLRQAGLHTTLAIDQDPDCCKTMQANHPDVEVVQSSVADVEASLGRFDMVVGGPPCQNFSTANTQKTMDPTEVNRFFRIVKESGARHLIMENVQGVLKVIPKNLPYHRYFVNCADYGVPQIRRRVIVTDLPLPKKTHLERGGQFTLDGLNLPPWVSIRDALGLEGLLCNRSHRFHKNNHFPTSGPVNTLLGNATYWFRPAPDYVVQDRRHQDGVRNYSVDRPSYTIQTDTRMFLLSNLKEKWPIWYAKHPPSNIRKPAYTLTARDRGKMDKMITDNKHVRKLTVDELATLQGFPKSYCFVGNKGERIRQIGNALPPAVTKAFVAPLVMVKA